MDPLICADDDDDDDGDGDDDGDESDDDDDDDDDDNDDDNDDDDDDTFVTKFLIRSNDEVTDLTQPLDRDRGRGFYAN